MRHSSYIGVISGGFQACRIAAPSDDSETYGYPVLYHIALPADWAAAQEAGTYTASTRGRTLGEEGFIHCSFAEQVAATAARFYRDLDAVVLLEIDPDRLTSAVVVEDVLGTGEAFPHVYGPIELTAVVAATPTAPTAIRF